ncbi:MAG: selenocysteine-specific translation elongation factor [Deltaproteobacteria bacterium]|nr:selenocysteine-specific translation elongation factor [Deltaproteobacteria bacterium]
MEQQNMPHITRISAVIGTAGHIDHGKTSLVRALTGIDTDRLKEEKKRGLSIDIGFAYLDLDGAGGALRAAVIDVPGHERFIKNMLSGTTGIDMALFVVAADDGIMPQTLEHFGICVLLGIKRAVFAITKRDMAEEARIREVENAILKLIKGTAFEGSVIQPVSSVTGEGISSLKKLIEKALAPRARDNGGFFRLPIDRSFSVPGFGTVVTGTVASGSIKKGDRAVCFPLGKEARVRGLQSLFMEADEVNAGERAAVNISGISHSGITRGCVLADPALSAFSSPANTRRVDCFFEFLKDAKIKNNAILTVHHFTQSVPATIRLKGGTPSGSRTPLGSRTGRKADERRAFGRLILKKPMLMLRGDRFILRDPAINATVGGGVVHLPGLSKELNSFREPVLPLEGAELHELLASVFHGKAVFFDVKTVSLLLNIREDVLLKSFESKGPLSRTPSGRGKFAIMGSSIASVDRVEKLKSDIVKTLSDLHAASPAEAGVKEDQIFKAVRAPSTTFHRQEFMRNTNVGSEKWCWARCTVSFFKECLDVMITQGMIKRDGKAVALAGHCPRAAGQDAQIEAAVMALFQSGGFTARSMDEIRGLAFKPEDAARVFGYLVKRGVVVKIKEGVYMSGKAVNDAKERLCAHIMEKGPIKAAEFRDILGVGRKLAIEILEYFDRERVTLRQGDLRVLRGLNPLRGLSPFKGREIA